MFKLLVAASPVATPAQAAQHTAVTVNQVVAVAMGVLVNCIVVVACIAGLIAIAGIVFKYGSRRPGETMIRIVSFATALLVAFGAQGLGLSMPDLIGNSLMSAGSAAFAFFGVVFPGALGVAVSWFLIHMLRHNTIGSFRLLIFIGTLVLVTFTGVYASAVGAAGTVSLNRNLAPNTVFLVGLGLYAMLNYVDHHGMEQTERPPDEEAGTALPPHN